MLQPHNDWWKDVREAKRKMLTYSSFSFSIVGFLSEWTWFDVAWHGMASMHAANSNKEKKCKNRKRLTTSLHWKWLQSKGLTWSVFNTAIKADEIIFIEKHLAASGHSCIITVRKAFIPMEKHIPLFSPENSTKDTKNVIHECWLPHNEMFRKLEHFIHDNLARSTMTTMLWSQYLCIILSSFVYHTQCYGIRKHFINFPNELLKLPAKFFNQIDCNENFIRKVKATEVDWAYSHNWQNESFFGVLHLLPWWKVNNANNSAHLIQNATT